MRSASAPPIRMRVNAIRLGALVALALAIEVAPRAGWIDDLTLIPASEAAVELIDQIRAGEVMSHIGRTVSTITISFVAAVLSGLLFGYLTWRSRRASRMLAPYLTSYYSLPVFALYPVLIAIFGLNQLPIILLAWAWAVVAVIVNVMNGFDRVSDVHHRVGQLYGLRRLEFLWHILVPASRAYIFSGMKLAVTYSVTGVIASEFILSTKGMGYLIAYDYNSFRIAPMYASIFLVVAMSALLTISLRSLEKRLRGA